MPDIGGRWRRVRRNEGWSAQMKPKPPCPSLLSPTARLPFNPGLAPPPPRSTGEPEAGKELGAELRPRTWGASTNKRETGRAGPPIRMDGVRMLDEAEPSRRLHSCSWRQGGPRGGTSHVASARPRPLPALVQAGTQSWRPRPLLCHRHLFS